MERDVFRQSHGTPECTALKEHAAFAQLVPTRLVVRVKNSCRHRGRQGAMQTDHVLQQRAFPEPLLPMMTNTEPRLIPVLMSRMTTRSGGHSQVLDLILISSAHRGFKCAMR
jgi:hypothetical protein